MVLERFEARKTAILAFYWKSSKIALLAQNPKMPKIAILAPLDFGDKPCQRAIQAQIEVSGLMEPADKISLPGDTRRCHFEGARNRDFGSPAQVPWRPVGPSNQRLASQDAVGARSSHAQTIS